MLPDELAKTDTEHAHQRAFFQWINLASRMGFGLAKHTCNGKRIDAADIALAQNSGVNRPELSLFHAIPNGGHRSKPQAAKLRAEGVKAGVLDTFLPVPQHKPQAVKEAEYAGYSHHIDEYYCGLYIEFKDPARRNHANGGLSDAQLGFAVMVQQQGYHTAAAYTWREAANIVMEYYGVDTRFDVEYRIGVD